MIASLKRGNIYILDCIAIDYIFWEHGCFRI